MNRKSEQAGILRRGSACLCCRRRKLRCDGVRPVCSPCSTMKRSQECKYDDSCRKSRTQTLREKKAALEARLQELEAKPRRSLSMPSAASTWPRDFDDPYPNTASYPIDLAIWCSPEYDSPLSINDGSPFLPSSFQFDESTDFTLCASPDNSFTLPDISTQPDGCLSPLTAGQRPLGTLSTFSDTSSNSVEDGGFDSLLHDMSPSPITSRQMNDVLIESFILHHKQCFFYSDISRIDPSSSPHTCQNPSPNVALMSAIYLMGAFFARMRELESQLLKQALHEVSRSLHNSEPPADMVQALCLIAQYLFFTGRDMEGSCHLSAAKRIATDIGLHPTSGFTFTDWQFPLELDLLAQC